MLKKKRKKEKDVQMDRASNGIWQNEARVEGRLYSFQLWKWLTGLKESIALATCSL